ETFGLALARHFVDDTEPVQRARIKLEMYPWVRLEHAGSPHPHAFARDGGPVRTPTGTYDGGRAWGVSGGRDPVPLKTARSEFHGYLRDRYTTLQPTDDRIMATAVTAQWWHTDPDVDYSKSYAGVMATLTDVFAGHYSLALQQTMYAMGEAVLDGNP